MSFVSISYFVESSILLVITGECLPKKEKMSKCQVSINVENEIEIIVPYLKKKKAMCLQGQ